MKLSIRLPLAFALLSLLACCAALGVLWVMDRSIETYRVDVLARTASEREAARIESAFKTQVQEWKNVLLRGQDPKQLDRYWNAFLAAEKDVGASARRLLDALGTSEGRAAVAAFVAAHATMGEGYRKGLEAFRGAGFAPAAGDAAVKGIDREPVKLLAEAAARIATEREAVAAAADSRSRRVVTFSLAALLVVTAGGIATGVLIARGVTRPLRRAVEIAERVAAGDLTQPVDARGRDETSQLLASLAAMQQALARVVAQVRNGAESIATASAQIAQGTGDLSGRTESQAAAVEQTSASLRELDGAMRANAEHATQASRLASVASDSANRGGSVVDEVVSTMRAIDESSKRIADIIGVIDGIAFQTNILALNAAVEAARAGEQGRGFAVVASEVRTLAQRSAAAAREITELISTSVQRVERGTELADDAGRTMQEVVTSIRRVADIVGEISQATVEQTGAVTQVTEAVAQIDGATQQNAALVEQSAAAAESLGGQAAALVQAVAVFRCTARAA
jgi:methyl-accepting chemotaxis protein-1 (serine sensor receptor)